MALNHDPNLNDALYYQMLAVKQKEEARQAALRTAEATESTVIHVQELDNQVKSLDGELISLRAKLNDAMETQNKSIRKNLIVSVIAGVISSVIATGIIWGIQYFLSLFQ